MSYNTTRKRNTSRKTTTLNANSMLVSTGFIVVVAVVCAIVYMMTENHCSMLGNDIASLERELKDARDDLRRASAEWSIMTSPAAIDRILRDNGIQMAAPDMVRGRVVRLRAIDAGGMARAGLASAAGAGGGGGPGFAGYAEYASR